MKFLTIAFFQILPHALILCYGLIIICFHSKFSQDRGYAHQRHACMICLMVSYLQVNKLIDMLIFFFLPQIVGLVPASVSARWTLILGGLQSKHPVCACVNLAFGIQQLLGCPVCYIKGFKWVRVGGLQFVLCSWSFSTDKQAAGAAWTLNGELPLLCPPGCGIYILSVFKFYLFFKFQYN